MAGTGRLPASYVPAAARNLEYVHLTTTERFAKRRLALPEDRAVLEALKGEVHRLEVEQARLGSRLYVVDDAAANATAASSTGPRPFKAAVLRRATVPSANHAEQMTALQRALEKAQRALAAQQQYTDETASGKAEMDYMLRSAEVINNYYVRKAAFDREARQFCDNPEEYEAARMEFDSAAKRLFTVYIDKCHPELRSEESRLKALRAKKTCRFCGSDMQVLDDVMKCVGCGHCERDVGGGRIGETYMSYADRDQCTTLRIYKYQRLNHFREILRLVQGITRTGITEDVADKFRAAMRAYQIAATDLTPAYARILLKRIGEARCYKFIHCICADFNPTYEPIVIEPEHFERLVRQFVAAEGPYEATKKSVNPKRKNFLNYPYVASALCVMNNYPQYLRAFKPLKSMELRIQQDRLWAKVCAENYWPFRNIEGSVSIARDFSGRAAKRERVADEEDEASSEVEDEEHAEEEKRPVGLVTCKRHRHAAVMF